MARDYFDESKDKKKKKTKAATTNTSQSSSVAKTNKTVNNVNDKAQKSTFLGGGSTSSYQNQNQKPKTVKKPAAQKQTSTASTSPRQTTPQRTTDTGTGRRRTQTTAAQRQKMGMPTSEDISNARTSRRTAFNKVDDLARRTAARANEWESENLSARNQMLDTQRTAKNKKAAERASERMQERFEKQTVDKSKMQETALGRTIGNASDRWVEREKGILLNTASTLADFGDMLNDEESNKRGRLGEDFSGLLPDSKDTKRKMQQSYKDYADKADASAEKLSKLTDKAASNIVEKKFYEAEDVAQGMISDKALSLFTGGNWAIPLFARTYSQAKRNAEAAGATQAEARAAGLWNSAVEIATEGAGGYFGKGDKLLGKVGSKLENRIVNRFEGESAKKVASFLARWERNNIEESLEEVIGNPLQNVGENVIYRNRLQQERQAEEDARLSELGSSIQKTFAENPTEVESYIAELNSPDTRASFVRDFMRDNNLNEEQANAAADKMLSFMEAAAMNDTQRMKEISASLSQDLSGDTTKKVFDWNDTLNSILISHIVGVGSGVNAASTMAQGQTILNDPNSKTAMQNALRKTAAFDKENSTKAKGLLETMERDDYKPTPTQAFDIMANENGVMAESAERQRASEQVKERAIRRENLSVPVSTISRDGKHIITGQQTTERYVNRVVDTFELIDAINSSIYNEAEKVSDEVTERMAEIVPSFDVGTLDISHTADLTTDHTEERYIFKEMTGVDLDQYNVYDKNGKLDTVASNIKMQEGLLALSAQNYIESARIEQEAWNDQARGEIADALGSRFNPMGDIAIHDALNSVDPRDQAQFMLMTRVAQDVYRYSYNTQDEWQDVKRRYQKMYPSLDVDALEGMYESAKEDRVEAETPYLNYEVKVGEALNSISKGDATPQIRGKFVNETSFNPETGEGITLPESDRIVYASLAKGINANITMIDAQDERLAYIDENGNTQYNNASVDLATGDILISNAVDAGTAVHEVTHVGARLASRYYRDLADYIFDKAYKYDPEKTMRILDAYRRTYADQNLSDAKLKEEVVSDLVAAFQDDPRFARDIAQDNPSLVRKIINAIEDLLRSLRNILATGKIQDPAVQNSFLVEIGAYEEARRMWLEMYREAQKNNAALGLAKWHENAIRDNRIANARHTNVEQAEKERELFLRDSEGNGLTERQAQIVHDIGPDIRFSRPTFLNDLAKGEYFAGLNNGTGGFAGLKEIASGKDILIRTMQKNGFTENQTDAVVGFLTHMADYLDSDELQMRYSFIGWQDLTNAEITVRRDKDDNIVGVAVSAMVANGEYPVNFDMTTICNKREGVMEVIQELTRKYDADTGRTILNSVKLTDEKMWNINKALKAEGIDTACLGCFVEARRYYTNRFIDKIDDVWNSAVREARRKLGLPEEEYFNFAKGKKVSGEDYNKISDLWTAYDESTEAKRSPAQRIKILMDEIVRNKEVDSPYLKLISAEDILTPEGIDGFKKISTKDRDMVKMIKSIYGTSAPKEILAFTPYNSEIALLPEKIKGKDAGAYLRSIGGTRVQSFSDFKMAHMFDHMQMVADEAARGFVNHGYSKVIAYPRLFGLTGRKINMSVMFDVLPASEWQSVLGCSEEAATEVAKKYQGLRFVKEKPEKNPDNRPYIETEIEGVHGYLTYLVSDADYVNSVFDELYQQYLAEGMDEDTARREANKAKPFEQSINYREAVALENQDGYKENVGIIAVAYGDEHLKILLDDPNVRYIIPYHRSGLPVFIAQKTALDIARDYTDSQNTRKAKRGMWFDKDGTKFNLKARYKNFKAEYEQEEHPDGSFPAIEFFKEISQFTFDNPVLTEEEINEKLNEYIQTLPEDISEEDKKELIKKRRAKLKKKDTSLPGTGSFDVYKDLDKVSDIREISNAYLEHCINKNQVPIFYDFAAHPNYYKMLFDFAVTDAEGNIYPQRPVRNVYPGLDIDAKAAAGEEITEEDYAEFYKAIEEGLQTENAKNELRSNRLGKVLDEDLLSREGENSIIADSNIQHIVNGTPDYTNPKGSDVANSRLVSNEELAARDDVAIFIKNTKQVNYIDLIFKGEKTEETRPMRTLDKFIGKEVAVTDGKKVYGTVVLGEPHKYSAEDFRSDKAKAKHHVPDKDDEYSAAEGKGKWAYPIESYSKYDEPKALSDSKDYVRSYQAREMKFSRLVNLDDDYMAAVNSGNMDEAQRLVDEAAKMAGFDTPLFHGTDAFGFTTIDNEAPGADGFSFWAASREDASATYTLYGQRRNISDRELSEEEQDAMYDEVSNEIDDAISEFRHLVDITFSEWVFGQQDNSYLRSLVDEANPQPGSGDGVYDVLSEIVFDAYHDYGMDSEMEFEDWSEESEEGSALWDAVNNIEALRGKLADIENGEIKGGIYGLYANADNLYELDAEGKAWNELRPKGLPELTGYTGVGTRPYRTRDVANWARENGYDGVRFKNIKDNGPYGRTSPFDVYAFFKPQEQVKSSDTVTYAEDGSIIPLSERFDPTNNDIRYSRPTIDAEGNILTDGQMEYFKNSQARDIFGRLVPVYHATDMGGFTIFDPWKSDDHRSLFFSNRRDVAKTYAYNGGNAFDFAPKELNNWGDLIQYGRQLFSDADMSWDNDTDDNNLDFELHDKETGNFADIGYDEWLSLVESNDPHADDYRVKISLPYNNKDGETDYVSFEGDSAEDLLNKVSNGNIPHGGHYQVYLNLENPLIIDGQGQPWNNIVDGGSVFPAYSSITLRNRSWFEEEAEGRDEMYDRGQSLYNGDNARARAQEFEGDDYVEIEIFNGKKKIKAIIPLTEEAVAEEAAAAFGVDDLELLQGVASEIVGDMEFGNITKIYDDDMRNTIGEYGYNTREWAEFAEDEGHDGVIFRNIIDIDDKTEMFDSEEEAASDVYVAFSSNQVKDVNNADPTENPDIRYSRVTEDEVMSKIAYDDAMDNSYELLTYYEQQIGIVNPETFDVTKAFKEEDVVRFLEALKSEDYVPSTDAVFEEDRVRRAKSKEDFYNNVYAKWNDRWTTEGEVLKISSVKRDITNLVKGAMANSDSDAQYRNEIVRKTLLDARIAYQLMKQDRTELASYLLYHSAQRMIDGLEFIRDDTAFKEYKEIRDFLRQYTIYAPDEYWQNEKFNDFRKEYFGRLRIGKGKSNIVDVYKDCQDRWPHLFNEAEREKADNLGDAPEDLLLHIGVVVDSNVTPFYEAYSSEEATSFAFDLADQLYEIIANGDREVSLADSYKERFDAKTKALKARHAEAILRERKIRAEGIRKERIKFREYKETQKEKTLHTKYFTNIKSKYDELTKRLLTNTKEKHIPEQYKRELAELLKAFDFQTVGSKKREARTGYKAQNTIKLEAMRTALERIEANSQLFHINDSITDIMKDLLGLNEASMNKQSIEGKTLDELSASELKKIDKLLGALLHEFNNYEKVRVGVKKQQAADIGHAQNDISLEHAEAIGEGKDYQTPFLQSIDRIVNLDMMTPAFLFRKIDPNNEGLGLMWKEIRKSFDKYVRNTNQLNEWIEDIVGQYHEKGILWNKYGSGELSKWRSINYAKTFNLTYGPLELTPAQMMSVACLANRKQAREHMSGAGVVVAPVSFQAKITQDIKKKLNKSISLKLTDADIETITAALTPEQRQVANKLQELMATKMAAWGNEASVNVLGIKLFEDPDYFPIRSDKKGLTKDLDPNQFEQAIRNFGFTKAVQPGARNAIMIDDIFDVVTEHCNNMNLYNSYTEAMNDFMKVYNYREIREDGEYTVEQALSHAFSEKAPMFIMQFMRDLNGNVSGRASGIESMYNALLANAKKASVFANFRVAAQQPTAISRAFYVIDEKYIKGIKVDKDAMTEMFEHCPIALWKSWGYYDINMGKSIEDVIMNNGRWLEDKATDLYGALDNVTWTAIWQMVKAETKDLYPELKEGTDEFFEHCNERMSEVVDLTQVVDSPMHRSHAMRDKGFFKKLTTAFMAEPTLTFNMLRDGVTRTSEAYKRGKKKLASQILSRTIGVYLLQSVMVAGAQSLVDALRGKKPDKDDDDDRFLHLWWVNFVENWKDEFNPLGKIYVVKDFKSMMDGWENRNLALQGVYYLSLGYKQFTGNPYARSSKSWYENMLYGMGYLTGVPIKTMMTGVSNAKNMLGIQTPIFDEYAEYLDSLAGEKDGSEASIFGGSIGELLKQSMDATANMMGYKPIEESTAVAGATVTGKTSKSTKEDGKDSADSVPTRESLPDNLTDEQKEEIIKSAERRSKTATAAEDVEKRDYDTMLYDAMKAASGYEGEKYNKKIWESVSKGYKAYVEEGNYERINMMRRVVEEAGGDLDYFDKQVNEASKTALKKSIKSASDMTEEEYYAQKSILGHLRQSGMTDGEISEYIYKSDTRTDLQVAMRINDEDAIFEELTALVNVGFTQQDFEKAYKNRNRVNLKNYKDKGGKYSDRLKSMGTFIWPTDGVITSHFGYRNAPTAGASSNHPAIDIGAPQGTAVVAADGGVVISAGANGGYGNSVGIKHDNGMITWYNHLYDWNVKVGDTVAQGQQIAQVGSTGISTGPHLDFKIMNTDGEPVDPEKYLAAR